MNLISGEKNLEKLNKELNLYRNNQSSKQMLNSLILIIEHSLQAKRFAEQKLE